MMTSTWPSQSMTKLKTSAMINSTGSNPTCLKDLAQANLVLLQKVLLSLTSIETSLEVLLQVLWVQDSQELS